MARLPPCSAAKCLEVGMTVVPEDDRLAIKSDVLHGKGLDGRRDGGEMGREVDGLASP